jgi:prepilin-type N-terminal cleavage/methylation domain-containing protein
MSPSKGFTLAEMAVAVVILALLLFGAMVPFSAQVEIRNVADTRRTMDSIKDAIIGFAQANGRLPCPADGTIPAGGTDAAGRPAGAEQLTPTTLPPPSTAACTNSFGAVPWTTLGVAETDGWGRRFSYWVSPIFADGIGLNTFNNAFPTPQNPLCNAPIPAPTQSSFALCSQGSFTVNTRSESTHVATAVGLALPAVIISHGKNGFGAYTPGGVTLAAPAGADELANATHTGAPGGVTTFYSRIPTPAPSGGCNDAAVGQFCAFDDTVVMISSNALIARMVAAGRLP